LAAGANARVAITASMGDRNVKRLRVLLEIGSCVNSFAEPLSQPTNVREFEWLLCEIQPGEGLKGIS
jgi:hypothetical protein